MFIFLRNSKKIEIQKTFTGLKVRNKIGIKNMRFTDFDYVEQKNMLLNLWTKNQHSLHSVCANSDKFDEIP